MSADVFGVTAAAAMAASGDGSLSALASQPPHSRLGKSASGVAANASQRLGGAGCNAAAAASPMEQVLQTGQPFFSTKLDFLKVNRTVAALERAVERLELLTLLDTAPPAEESMSDTAKVASASAAAGGGGTRAKNSMVATRTATARGAAIFEGDAHDATSATSSGVRDALNTASQRGGRGRPSVLELLAELRQLEQRYGELLVEVQPVVSLRPGEPQLRPQCFRHVRDARQVAIRQELQHISSRLRDTNRLMCTQLQDNPQDTDNWTKVANERRELTALLQDAIAELTAGYKEVFQQRTRRTELGSAGTLSTFNSRPSGATGAATADPSANRNTTASVGFVRSNSRRSSATAGAMQSSEGGSQQAALKRFGSTVQRRRASHNAPLATRIPLASSYHGFAVKILQEQAAQQWADGVLTKERALNQNVKQLQTDLRREEELRDKEVGERKARISALQLELRQLRTGMRQRSEAAKIRGDAVTEALQRDGASSIVAVQTTESEKTHGLAVEGETHRAFADYLRQRTQATETLDAEWAAKALQELKRKEAAKMDAESNRQACAQRLADLEQEHVTQKSLQAQRDDEAAVQQHSRQRRDSMRAAEYAAASVLQAALKAMMTRQTLNKGKKSGGKKKKKKK